MSLHIATSAYSECSEIVDSFRKSGKNTSRVVEKRRDLEQVREKANGQDPYTLAQENSRKILGERGKSTYYPHSAE